MKLKDKTYKKFLDFFERTSKKHDYQEFEIAYSEIQRETGVASITLKKAIQVLEKDGIIVVNQGRNTRYGRFRYLLNSKDIVPKEIAKNKDFSDFDEVNNQQIVYQLKNMSNHLEQLRQRVRTQEMTISVILERLAELEDRVHR